MSTLPETKSYELPKATITELPRIKSPEVITDDFTEKSDKKDSKKGKLLGIQERRKAKHEEIKKVKEKKAGKVKPKTKEGFATVGSVDTRRLYRSRKNRIFGGIAGGIGEYLGIDPTIVRIIWTVFSLLGAGIIAYIAAWMVIPLRPAGKSAPAEVPRAVIGEAGLIIGLILVALGSWFLLTKLNLIPPQFFHALRVVRQALWPISLILIGTVVIVATSRGYGLTFSARGRTLYRSRQDRKVAGVAGGVADYFGVDATLVRLAWMAFTIASVYVSAIAYAVAAVIIPEEPS